MVSLLSILIPLICKSLQILFARILLPIMNKYVDKGHPCITGSPV